MVLVRLLLVGLGLLLSWQLVVVVTGVPRYILPGPLPVFQAVVHHWSVLFRHLLTTVTEIGFGLLIGVVLGCSLALAMHVSPLLKRWLLPVLVASQAIPVFALAPVLVLWLGYGMSSKIAMAVLIIFFPVASSFFYGLRRTSPDLLELARIMDGGLIRTLRLIVIPSALPALASGIRVAAAVAPIGAVVGEWVGSSSGLGFYMLHANARMQVDRMFAALALLSAVALAIYFGIDFLMNRMVYWEQSRELNHEKDS